MKSQTPTERLIYRLRMWNPHNLSSTDILYDAVDHLVQLAGERDAAVVRVTELEAELIATRALVDERKVA